MIPIKLQLKNFLSYGSEIQTIDFSPYHLICLSGKNGHGKSALLDAITWALWGQARKTTGVTKADEGLLRLGQTQMFVALDFEFNGQLYRVRREFAKTYGKPYTALDFGLLDREKDELIPLTDKTIRQTQVKIDSMLNLDIESFVNSAFLRQGQSNEFSKKSSKERKNVLATILGLNRYEIIKILAAEKVKEAQLKKEHITTLQTKISQELEHKATIITQIETLEKNLQNVVTQEQALDNTKQTLEKRRITLNEEQNAAHILAFKYHQILQEESEQQQSLRTVVHEWRAIQRKIGTLHEQKQYEDEKRALVHTINEHQLILQKSLEIKEQLLKKKEEKQLIEQTIKEAFITTSHTKKIHHERLNIEGAALQAKITHAQQQIDRHTLEQKNLLRDISKLEAHIAQESVSQQPAAAFEKQFERRKEYYQKFIAQGTWIKNELDGLQQKNGLVLDDDNPSCPLCEQNLSATRKRFLRNRFEEHEQFLRHRIMRLKRVTTALKAILIEHHAQLMLYKKNGDELKASTLQLQELIKQQHKNDLLIKQEYSLIDQLTKEQNIHTIALTTSTTDIAALTALEQHQLTTNASYQDVIQSIATLETTAQSITYDSKKHQDVLSALQAVEKKLETYSALAQQATLQIQRMKTVRDLCAQLKKINRNKIELAKALKAYSTLDLQLQTLAQEITTLATAYDNLKKQKEALLHEKGSLENQATKLTQLEQEYTTQQNLIVQLHATIEDYQNIATAAGKDGIQALLIEEAIPEIEQEANMLLAKLTNNQAQIFIESLRDLKSGGTKETLDIKISDSIGIRPYEMFSGGEAFRIDFALRIAISKLLARRAGTSLQTLIIDEGFGSQDEEGLSTIMDALYKVQEDFSKVIIVSHLPAMKDQFPVHFLVEKGPNGSMVRVMEQG